MVEEIERHHDDRSVLRGRERSGFALLPVLAHVAGTARLGGHPTVSIVCAAEPHEAWAPALGEIAGLMAEQAGLRMTVSSIDRPFDRAAPVGLVFTTTEAAFTRALDRVLNADPSATLRHVLVVVEGTVGLLARQSLTGTNRRAHRTIRLGPRVPVVEGRELVVVTVSGRPTRRHCATPGSAGERHRGT